MMKRRQVITLIPPTLLALGLFMALAVNGNAESDHQNNMDAASAAQSHSPHDQLVDRDARRLIEEGRNIFRFDTFGNEAFWGRCTAAP
jgi:hypothetical protein